MLVQNVLFNAFLRIVSLIFAELHSKVGIAKTTNLQSPPLSSFFRPSGRRNHEINAKFGHRRRLVYPMGHCQLLEYVQAYREEATLGGRSMVYDIRGWFHRRGAAASIWSYEKGQKNLRRSAEVGKYFLSFFVGPNLHYG